MCIMYVNMHACTMCALFPLSFLACQADRVRDLLQLLVSQPEAASTICSSSQNHGAPPSIGSPTSITLQHQIVHVHVVFALHSFNLSYKHLSSYRLRCQCTISSEFVSMCMCTTKCRRECFS